MPATNIDTDQIIPARFLTTTTRSGLGEALFADLRYDANGKPRPDFVLILPWNLRDEIAAQLAYVRAWGARLVVPIPRLEVF